MIKVSEINIYPVKSLGSINKSSIHVQSQGLAGDRCYMLVDQNNQFITQRKHPKLALVSVKETSEFLTINAPNMPELNVNKKTQFNFKRNSNLLKVNLWSDICSAIPADDNINQWFSEYLKLNVSMVGYNYDNPRQSDPLFSRETDTVSFADGFPILLISQASLNDLNQRLANPVSMQRFRPNIVVEGCEAFEEDQWRNITIGKMNFEAVKICSRCVLTTIDPITGVKDKSGEPLRTLSQYRKNIKGVKDETGVFFGINLIPRGEADMIKVEDTVTIELNQ